MLHHLVDHAQFMEEERQLFVGRHRMHVEGKPEQSARDERIHAVERFDLRLRIPLALLPDVVEGDLVPAEVDRVQGSLQTAEAFLETGIPLADRRREFVRQRDPDLVDVDPRLHQLGHRGGGVLGARLPQHP